MVATNENDIRNMLSDTNYPVRSQEWDTFLERRNQLIDDILTKIGFATAMQGVETDVNPIETLDAQALKDALDWVELEGVMEQRRGPEGMRQRDYMQTLGAADEYGIQNPEDIPIGELQQIIEQRRLQSQENQYDNADPTMMDMLESALGTGLPGTQILTSAGPYALGGIDALVRTAETIPFIGDWVSDRDQVQQINRDIGRMRENALAHMTEEEMRGFQLKEGIGEIIGYTAPGFLSWRIAGGLLGIKGLSGMTRGASQVIQGRNIIQRSSDAWGIAAKSPILHSAIQGGFAAWMLEAGGDGPISERVMNIVLGTALGTAFEIGGPVGAAAFGGTVGGIAGASIDETPEGIALGIASGLALNRVYRGFLKSSGLGRGKFSQSFEYAPEFDDFGPWGQYGPERGPMGPSGPQAPPSVGPGRISLIANPGPSINRNTTMSVPRGRLPAGPIRQEIDNLQLPEAEVAPPSRQLEEVGEITTAIENTTFSGTRTLFYAGNENPNELIRRWGTLTRRGTADPEGFENSIILDNTGKLMPGTKHVHEVEASFDNLFVLTPESAPTFNQLMQGTGAQGLQDIQNHMQSIGFDGIAVQGIDNVINQVGPDVVFEQLGIPTQLMQDQVIAFGTPAQVKYSRPIIDGDLLDEAFSSFGSANGRQIAATQSATFSREASKQLSPFPVGSEAPIAPPPQWISETRGVGFRKDPNAEANPLVPPEVTDAVLRHSEQFGPQVLLLDENRIAKATIPVRDLEEGTETLARLGFDRMDPNTTQEAIELAEKMTQADQYLNNPFSDLVGQLENPTPTDLVALAHASNPGRLAVVQNVGDPFEILRNLKSAGEIYNRGIDFDRNVMIVERPNGKFDAITGPEEFLTPKIREQYKKYGVFSSMEATAADGSTVRVNSVWSEGNHHRASISPLFSDIKATVPLDYVLPGRTSVQQPLTGDVYKKFERFALGRFNEDARKAGIEQATDLLDDRVLTQIDRYIDQYAADQGFPDGYTTERFAGSLEWNVAQRYNELAGPDGKFFKAMLRDEANAMTKATLKGDFVVPDLEQIAATKGFIWEPPWRGKPGQLVDEHSNLVISFYEKDSALAYLRGLNRELPDVTPTGAGVGNAFQGFGNHSKKSSNGIEFANETVEREAAIRSAAASNRQTEQQIAELRKALDILEDVKRANREAGIGLGRTPPPFDPEFSREAPRPPGSSDMGAGGTPPPPPPPPSSPPTPQPDGGDELVKRTAARARTKAKTKEVGPEEDFIQELREMLSNDPSKERQLSNVIHSPLVRLTAPMRVAAQILDEKLLDMGISQPIFHKYISNILQGKIKATNQAQPWLAELSVAISKFNRAHRRKGPLYEVLTASHEHDEKLFRATGFATQRNLLMDKYGFTDVQKETVQEVRRILNQLHEEAGMVGDIGYIFDYLPRLRYFMDIHGDSAYRTWASILPDDVKWFAMHARTGNLHAYHKDVGRVLDSYVRGLFFEKHIRTNFEILTSIAKDKRTPTILKDYIENFLYVVRHGHPPGYDTAVQSITEGINNMFTKGHKYLGLPKWSISEGETMSMVGVFSTMQYRGLLGNTVKNIVRELYQPMIMAPEIGIKRMLSSYYKFMTSPAVRQEWTERAMKYGWSEPNRHAVGNTEFFTGELKNIHGKSAFTPEEEAAREMVANMWDKVYDTLPQTAKLGMENNPFLNPLWSYRVFATNPARILVSNAAFEHAMDAINLWQRGKVNFDGMMKRSGIAYKPWSVRNEFTELIEAGRFEDAAALMGNEGAATAMFHGIAEQSQAIRNSGMKGRLFMQFGNFSNQFAWKVAREIKKRPPIEKAKYITRLAALATIPSYVGAEIGWEEMKRFNWFRSLLWSGGTLVDPVINAWYTASATRKMIVGDPLSPEERFAAGRFSDMVANIPFFPYSSSVRTVTGYWEAFQQDDPLEALLRMSITGMPHDTNKDHFLQSFTDAMIEEAEQGRQFDLNANDIPARGITPEQMEALREIMNDRESLSGGGSRN